MRHSNTCEDPYPSGNGGNAIPVMKCGWLSIRTRIRPTAHAPGAPGSASPASVGHPRSPLWPSLPISQLSNRAAIVCLAIPEACPACDAHFRVFRLVRGTPILTPSHTPRTAPDRTDCHSSPVLSSHHEPRKARFELLSRAYYGVDMYVYTTHFPSSGAGLSSRAAFPKDHTKLKPNR